MGMGFAPNWLRQVSPLLHITTLTTVHNYTESRYVKHMTFFICVHVSGQIQYCLVITRNLMF